jgi:hypothetical protein
VHSDFTDANGPEWARLLLTEGNETNAPVSRDEAEAIMQRRYAEFNIWRPTNGPVLRDPLAVLDSSTLGPDDVMVCKSEAGDVQFGVYNPAHRWYYVPKMETNEILIFKCYESAQDGRARFTLHSAFEHPETPECAPMRQSVEMRIFAFFD